MGSLAKMSWTLEDCGGWALSSIAAYVPWAACGLQTWAAALLPGLVAHVEPIYVGHRKFRVLKQLGEGGYAVVLLVQELPTPHRTHPDPELRALKKVLVQSGEHFEAVQQEMMIHSAVQHHPNILPLMDYCCSEGAGGPPAGAPPPHGSGGGLAAAAAATRLAAHPSGPSPVAAATAGGAAAPSAALPPPPTHPSLHPAFGDGGGRHPHPHPHPHPPHYHSHATMHEPQPLSPQALALPMMPHAGSGHGPGHGNCSGPSHGGAGPGPGPGLGPSQHGLPSDGVVAACCRVACFLFPVFREGTLAAELDRLAARGERLATADVLSLFIQMARATRHIHAHGYAHRDLKPLNVLIASNPDHPANRQQQQQQAASSAPASSPAAAVAAAVGGPRRPGGGGGSSASSSLARPLQGPGHHPGQHHGHSGDDVEAGGRLLGGHSGALFPPGARYRCVVMDFGSARAAQVQVPNRAAALALQEDAEAHCSAPYRAPELLDVPSPAALDYTACDVWALGASLFQLMYGEPPFARAMNAAGGSLALAVLNCAIGWPRPPAPAYPPELHDLVRAAMAPEPSERPTADQLVQMAEALAHRTPPLPDAK
ncbi:hypothetical protein HYH02_001013 [Chlamydomonas schloesseri]|uniref:non-specific serine/threonine protein kinase n=1 Tax=Chlamydomonas schloesseri TaxID=2026947 RepID=A0A836BBY8_9CHLO|nr:hypothetical protein HYH02_001013 [Chlamydomonas schloesseri]|eukprot:KAG2453967.1 hypothetical protein HYH02_001013 [Chlamydomonas schloesseri]